MKFATLGVMLCAGTLLAACTATDPKTRAGEPIATRACALSNTEADTCVNRGASINSVQICNLYVGLLPNGDPYVYPYRLLVPGGGVGNAKRRLVWHVTRGDLRFEVPDGPIELKNKPSDFPNPGPTKDIDGDNPGVDPAPRYRIENRYTSKNNPYQIRFKQRLSNGTIVHHECDPFIINSEAN